jgi:multimeric flavodoxin WrbA
VLISIVYDSGYGHTARRAEAVAEGIRRVSGVQAKLIAVGDGPIPLGKRVAEIACRFSSRLSLFSKASLYYATNS